jgi:virginiamycin B lyase
MMHSRTIQAAALGGAIALGTAFSSSVANADALLSGAVTSPDGKAMGGVTVSAKADGATITTTVFSDASGHYYFPPLPNGHYRVWAQALSFATAKGAVDLAANSRQNFTLTPLTGDYFQQLPGDLAMASLPSATPQDALLKKIVENNCTGCHQPNYPLQHRFDAAGWSAVLDLMKNVNVSGVYLGADHKPQGVIDHNQKELAAYLARVRGPGDSAAKIVLRPRPSGETARVVFKEYDVPLEADMTVPAKTPVTDGSDWLNGTPSRRGSLVHDGWADLDGNLWFTSNVPNHNTSIGRIDARTGKVKMFKVFSSGGLAANTHGMTRDPSGIIWFNCNVGRGALCRLDPKTEKIETFLPPEGMSPTGGATTVDWDGKGKIWVSSPNGALRFDPVTEKFTEFKSPVFNTPNGKGITYGAAGDRDGNGWWAEMIIDTVNQGVSATGKSVALKLSPVDLPEDAMSDADRKFYASFSEPDFNAPVPWNEGPRRMGTDKNGDVLWVGDSWGRNLAKIDIHSRKTSFVSLPGPGVMQPYHIAVDSHHDAWLNIWTSDVIMRYDPAANTWATFDLPTRGTEARYISLLEKDGRMEVVIPYSRTSKVAVMTFRSDADLAALKQQAGQ